MKMRGVILLAVVSISQSFLHTPNLVHGPRLALMKMSTENSAEVGPGRLIKAMPLGSVTRVSKGRSSEGKTKEKGVRATSSSSKTKKGAPDSQGKQVRKTATKMLKTEPQRSVASEIGSSIITSPVVVFGIPITIGISLLTRYFWKKFTVAQAKLDTKLVKNVGKELIASDGDLEAMRELQIEFAKQTGGDQQKRDELVEEYLRQSATQKPFCSDTIRALANVISVNDLGDARAAELIAKVANEFAISAVITKLPTPGKAARLFYSADRLLVDPEAVEILAEAKRVVFSTLWKVSSEKGMKKRAEEQKALVIAQTNYEASKRLLAKAALATVLMALPKGATEAEALRAAVAEGKLLGVDEAETAVLVAEIQADRGDLSKAKKALADAEKAEASSAEAEESASSGSKTITAECSKCKYTLFVAKGREAKFFGEGFACPQCRAPKSDFTLK